MLHFYRHQFLFNYFHHILRHFPFWTQISSRSRKALKHHDQTRKRKKSKRNNNLDYNLQGSIKLTSLGHWFLQQPRRFFPFTSAVVIFLNIEEEILMIFKPKSVYSIIFLKIIHNFKDVHKIILFHFFLISI